MMIIYPVAFKQISAVLRDIDAAITRRPYLRSTEVPAPE
jgi:hypothetical protein